MMTLEQAAQKLADVAWNLDDDDAIASALVATNLRPSEWAGRWGELVDAARQLTPTGEKPHAATQKGQDGVRYVIRYLRSPGRYLAASGLLEGRGTALHFVNWEDAYRCRQHQSEWWSFRIDEVNTRG